MIAIEAQQHPAEICLTLSGNQSASWADNKRYLMLQIGLSLFFSTPFIVMGYWVILLFIGGFYVILIISMRHVARATVRVEQLCITESTIAYSPPCVKSKSPCYREKTPRTSAQFDLLKDELKWYPTRLIMRVSDRRVVIGEGLTAPEREALQALLQEYLAADFDIAQIQPSSKIVSIPTIDQYSFF